MRKRSRYRPKPVHLNAIQLAVEAVMPIGEISAEYFTNLQIRNHAAMQALTHGKATEADMDTLIAIANIMDALRRLGVCEPLADDIAAAGRALAAIVVRAVKHLKFVGTGPEILALNTLIEQHDEMMPHITGKQFDQAIEIAKAAVRKPGNTMLMEAKRIMQDAELTT